MDNIDLIALHHQLPSRGFKYGNLQIIPADTDNDEAYGGYGGCWSHWKRGDPEFELTDVDFRSFSLVFR